MTSPITIAPFGTYTALTTGQVVNGTAAPLIAAMFVNFKKLLPDSANKKPASVVCPGFDRITPAVELRIRAELDALAAAIAAAPTS